MLGGRWMRYLKISRSKSITIWEYISVLMIILSSGSMYFTIMNVQITLYVLLLVSVVMAVIGKISIQTAKRNFMTLILIGVCVTLNLILNIQYAVLDNNIFILLIRLTSLFLMMSTITEESFVQKYVRIMYILAIIGLICFAYTMIVDYRLPFLIERSKNNINYYYTFYHTVGYRQIYMRNAGIFWEAPANAIFITMALVFVICRPELFPSGKKLLGYYVVFIVSIVSTLSAFAFVYLGVVAVLMLLISRRKKAPIVTDEKVRKQNLMRRYYVLGFVIMLIIVLCIENRFHLISHKLINGQGSFSTRFNDTYYSLELGLKRVLTGYGIFNNYTVNELRKYGIENNSNGIAILFMGLGLPLLIVASVFVCKRLKHIFRVSGSSFLTVAGLMFLFHFSEHLWLYTLFMSFLFVWRNSKGNMETKEGR